MEALATLIIMATIAGIGVMALLAWIGERLMTLVQRAETRPPLHAAGPPLVISSGQGKHRDRRAA
jgi:hypothetical protein